jgi:hypothetical protein
VNRAAEIYGRGVGFDASGFRLEERRVRASSGPENVREAIELILATEPGERLMRPAFGAGLRRFLFEPNVPATHRLIEEQITRALRRWEPRIALDEVRVAASPVTRTEAIATVRYRLVATGLGASVGVTVAVAGGVR